MVFSKFKDRFKPINKATPGTAEERGPDLNNFSNSKSKTFMHCDIPNHRRGDKLTKGSRLKTITNNILDQNNSNLLAINVFDKDLTRD